MAQAGRKTITQSFSFAPATLNALRMLAGERGTNLSVEMRAAVERHLHEARTADNVGDVKVSVKPKEMPSDGWRAAHPLPEFELGQRPADPRLARLPPKRYVYGAVLVIFEERPWSKQMVEQFEARLPTEVALLWGAEGERVLAENGHVNERPRFGGGMADPRKPEYGRESGHYR